MMDEEMDMYYGMDDMDMECPEDVSDCEAWEDEMDMYEDMEITFEMASEAFSEFNFNLT
jgi:hypothetical protein